MNDNEQAPTTAQVTVWRNLLDAFGQLNSASESAKDAQAQHNAGDGPASLSLPSDLVTTFARAGERS